MSSGLTTYLLAGSGTAVAVGLASATSFAASNAVQHRAAGSVPATERRALGVLGHLVKQPAWLFATCISTVAVVLHATALRFGSIALVQPLMLVGVVLAVPVRAALERSLPRWVEVRAVGVTAAGLAAFLVAVNPEPSHRVPGAATSVTFVIGCFVAGGCALRASGHRGVADPARQAALLGVGAGVMFGATAGLLKVVGTVVATRQPSVVAVAAAVAALVLAGLAGTAMNQKAYQVAPISRSLPVVNVVDLMVAVLFGAVVFGEVPGHGAASLTVESIALAVVGAGLRLIAALPLTTPQTGHGGGTPVGELANGVA